LHLRCQWRPERYWASISDGTCTWKYLSGVDYITATAFATDADAWSAGTTYTFGQAVTSSAGGLLQSFTLIGSGPSKGYSFLHQHGRPAFGTWSGDTNHYLGRMHLVLPGRYRLFFSDIKYSVENLRRLPKQRQYDTPHKKTTGLSFGMTGSTSPVPINENNPIGEGGHTRGGGIGFEGNQNDCVTGHCHYITFTAAAGESFRDSLTPSSQLMGYDLTKGVSFRNPNKCGGSACSEPAAFSVGDHWVRVDGLQMQSAYGAGIISWNNEQITNNIIDGGWNNHYTYGTAVWMDVFSVLANNLIISHGPIAFAFKVWQHVHSP